MHVRVCCSVLQSVAVCYAGITLPHTATHCTCEYVAVCVVCCSVLRRHTCVSVYDIATHCNTLQHTATHSTGACLQHTAAHCNTLQHTATHCNTLLCNTRQHTATHCSTLQHTAMQHAAAHCNILQRTATHCSTLQHSATYH